MEFRHKLSKVPLSLLAAAALIPATVNASVIDKPYFKANSIVIVFGADNFEETGGVAPVVYDFYLLDDASPDTAATDLIGLDGTTVVFNNGGFETIQTGSSSGWEFEINDPTSGGRFISRSPQQTLDANDAYTAFGLDADTDIDLLGNGSRTSQFFVASNAPFDIYGQSTNLVTTGDFSDLDYSNIRYRMRLRLTGGNGENVWGADAQDPSIGGAGVVLGEIGANDTLADMQGGPTKVFDGGQRTAASEGSIFSHAIAFQTRYNLLGADFTNYDFSLGTGSIRADVIYTVYTP